MNLKKCLLLIVCFAPIIVLAQNRRITMLIDQSEKYERFDRKKEKIRPDSVVDERDENSVISPCRYEKWEQVESFDEVVQLSPVNDVVWPGSIVQARSLQYGVPSPVPLRRTSGTITVDGLVFDNSSASTSQSVDEVTKASIEEAIHKIIYSKPVIANTANISYQINEINSVDQALLSVGVSADWAVAGLRAQLNSLDYQTKSNLIVKVVQNYFSVSFSKPDLKSPGAYFNIREGVRNAKRYISKENPPALISQVNYGRILVFIFSSEKTISELENAISAYYDGTFGGPAVTGEFRQEDREAIENSEVKIFGLGGNSQAILEVLPTASPDKIEQINNYIKSGVSFSPTSPGAIIGYKTTFLKDGTLASLNSSTKFYRRFCNFVHYKKPISVRVNKLLIFDTADDDEDMSFSYKIEFRDQNDIVLESLANRRSETYVEEPGKVGGERANVNKFFEGDSKNVDKPIRKLVVTVSARTHDGDGLAWGTVTETYEAIFNQKYTLSPFGRMRFEFEVR